MVPLSLTGRVKIKLLRQKLTKIMNFFRQYISPLIILLIFLVSLVAVSARIFLPEDLAAPAPIENIGKAVNGTITLSQIS